VERGWSQAPPCRAAGVVSRGSPLRRQGRRAPSRWSRRRGGSRQEEADADQGRHDDTKDQGGMGLWSVDRPRRRRPCVLDDAATCCRP
jgi:hypothetical protein